MTTIPQNHSSTLKPHAIGMIGVLTLEYLLGMFTNLFITFPQGAKDRQLWIFAWSQLSLALHIIVGILLFVGAIALVIRASLKKDKKWIIVSAVGATAILAAIIGGSIFIPTQSAAYSFIMAVTFLIALFSYFWGIYSSK